MIGFQWNWTFRYDDGDPATVDPSDHRRAGRSRPSWSCRSDRCVRFLETSNDVIHSF